jgi:O-Antigen ligase
MNRLVYILYLLYASKIAFSPIDIQSAYPLVPLDPFHMGLFSQFLKYALIGFAVFNLNSIWVEIRRFPIVYVLFGYAVFTLVYATDVSVTMQALTNVAPIFLVPVVLSKKIENMQIISDTFFVFSALIFVSVTMAYLQSPLAIMSDSSGNWRGIFAHKNAFGPFCAFGLWASIIFRRLQSMGTTKVLSYFATAFALVGLIYSGSSGSLLAFSGALIAVIFYEKYHLFSQHRSVIAILGFATFVILIVLFKDQTDDFLSIFGRDTTFTGRNRVWSTLVPQIYNRPFGLGYGASSLPQIVVLVSQSVNQYYNAIDNAYLVVALELGLPMTIIYFLFLLKSSLTSERVAKNLGYSETFCCIFLLLLAFVEKSGGPYASIPFAFLLIAYCKNRSDESETVKLKKESATETRAPEISSLASRTS